MGFCSLVRVAQPSTRTFDFEMMVTRFYRTKDLAESARVSVQQVRNYEASGLIPPVARSPSGYRLYTDQHLVAIQTVQQLIAGYGKQHTQQIMQAVHAGQLEDALATIDARHAALDRARLQLEQTLATLTVLTAQLPQVTHPRLAPRLRVGEAARQVGVRISALRHWEQQGLLHPLREEPSNYRLYDEQQLRRLRIVALLRQANHDFAAIRTTLDELEAGEPQRALAAVEQRRNEVARQSWQCVQALAMFYGYVMDFLAQSTREMPTA